MDVTETYPNRPSTSGESDSPLERKVTSSILHKPMSKQMSSDRRYHEENEEVPGECDLCILDDQRIFYIHHSTRTSHWEPPWAAWNCKLGLPYGWEQALDSHGHVYYIDHLNQTTTYSDPRRVVVPSSPRKVVIQRDPQIGFGFVAAGQHPTIIQFVSPGGPSDGNLHAHDEILSVDGVDVREETKENVVNMVRSAREQITLIVQQSQHHTPRRNCRVRFTDRVMVSNSEEKEFPPPMPNVLRVFLENGQTRSFKYDSSTTVRDVVVSLSDKLQMSATSHFSLAVEYSLGARTSRISLLRPETPLESIASLPNSSHLRCVFRFSFVPSDTCSLLNEDPKAFEYYYHQCVNDVVSGRFAYEMRYEACIRLAALHLQQLSIDTGCLKDGRVSISKMEKEFGLATFLPTILLENVKRKEIRKHLRYYLKRDDARIGSCMKKSCSKDDQSSISSSCPTNAEARIVVRLKYVQIVSHLPSFGGRTFPVTFKDSQMDMIMQVDPCGGVLVRHPGRVAQPTISIAFDLLSKLHVHPETNILTTVIIRLNNNGHQGLEFLVDKDDVADLTMFICGYYRLSTGKELSCEVNTDGDKEDSPAEPPPYAAVHAVIPAGWNYSIQGSPGEKVVDFSEDPPKYEVASTFAEGESENTEPYELPAPLRLPSAEDIHKDDGHCGRTLLKATDSLMIKSSKQLHLRETTSPLLRRASNPSGRKVDTLSDSSDTEDSSWSSPIRSPQPNRALSNISFGLNSPDAPPHHSSIETLIQSCQQNPSNLESLLLLFPDRICTDINIIDLTNTPQQEKMNGFGAESSGIEPHTTFVLVDGVVKPKLRFPCKCPVATFDEEEEKKVDFAFDDVWNQPTVSIESKIPLRSSSRIRPSDSFPVPQRNKDTVMDREAIQDFLRRSNSICDQNDCDLIPAEEMKVRRMSLKEFTGLDPPTKDQLADLSNPSWKTPVTSSTLLNSFSARRRSLIGADPAITSPAHKLSPQMEECLEISTVRERVEDLRAQLSDTMSHVPSESPRKRVPSEEERNRLLEESKTLAATCKTLVRCASQPGVSRSECSTVATEVYEAARNVATAANHMVVHCPIFQAQLVTSETDLVFSSLVETLSEAEQHLSQPNGTDQLVRASTNLAAHLTQLITSISSL